MVYVSLVLCPVFNKCVGKNSEGFPLELQDLFLFLLNRMTITACLREIVL